MVGSYHTGYINVIVGVVGAGEKVHAIISPLPHHLVTRETLHAVHLACDLVSLIVDDGRLIRTLKFRINCK